MTARALWTHETPLLLASASLARRTMLASAGIAAEDVAADIDERRIEDRLAMAGGGPGDIASALAEAKAVSISGMHPGRLVLGADQTLTCVGEAFHKPRGRAQAHAQIARLAGREHVLTSAFCLVRDKAVVASGTDKATLRMRALTDAAIDVYLDAAGPGALGSVGAYRLEDVGAHLFEQVDGDHFTVLGLPLFSVLAALRNMGVLAL